MLTYKRVAIIPKTEHILTRRIPGQGKVFVSVGQKVKAYEIVGLGEKSAGFRSFDLAKLLGVEPSQVLSYLTKNVGSFVYQGEVVAKKKEIWGLREIEITSPQDGILHSLDEKKGLIQLEYLPQKVKIPAGVPGVVSQVGPSLVCIKTIVTEIRGVTGMGKFKEGTLALLGLPELPLKSSEISSQMAGKIIAGGSLVDKEVLYKCLAVGVKGVVTGGINFADFQEVTGPRGAVEEVGLGVLVLEGFGNLPISKTTLEVLQKIDDQPVLLYGAQKKLVVPHLGNETIFDQGLPKVKKTAQRLEGFGILKEGAQVKLLTTNHLGLSGTIKKLESNWQELPSGIRTPTVMVGLEDGREVEVGQTNVEIIW